MDHNLCQKMSLSKGIPRTNVTSEFALFAVKKMTYMEYDARYPDLSVDLRSPKLAS